MVSPAFDPPDCNQIEAWIRAARDGCREALEQLIAASRNYLWAVANDELPVELRPKVAPSDLVQETLIEAHRDFAGFGGERQQELFAWLRRILLNNLANATRRYRDASKRELAREVAINAFDSATGRGVQLPAGDASPSNELMAAEQLRQVEAAIEQLPADYREVIVLRHREHLPFDEVASRMGRSPEAARKLWSRAIEYLQRELKVGDDE